MVFYGMVLKVDYCIYFMLVYGSAGVIISFIDLNYNMCESNLFLYST